MDPILTVRSYQQGWKVFITHYYSAIVTQGYWEGREDNPTSYTVKRIK